MNLVCTSFENTRTQRTHYHTNIFLFANRIIILCHLLCQNLFPSVPVLSKSLNFIIHLHPLYNVMTWNTWDLLDTSWQATCNSACINETGDHFEYGLYKKKHLFMWFLYWPFLITDYFVHNKLLCSLSTKCFLRQFYLFSTVTRQGA